MKLAFPYHYDMDISGNHPSLLRCRCLCQLAGNSRTAYMVLLFRVHLGHDFDNRPLGLCPNNQTNL